ncbi:hypothetical protein L7F22_059036 [Adiantum nelumboides]|nr:hypothetical protein [Adiantum nelumboides]
MPCQQAIRLFVPLSRCQTPTGPLPSTFDGRDWLSTDHSPKKTSFFTAPGSRRSPCSHLFDLSLPQGPLFDYGNGLVLEDEHTLPESDYNRNGRIFRGFLKLFPSISDQIDNDAVTSLHAYLCTCSETDYEYIAFVTKNETMHAIIVEESTREGLCQVARAYGFSAPRLYKFIDGERFIQPITLQW